MYTGQPFCYIWLISNIDKSIQVQLNVRCSALGSLRAAPSSCRPALFASWICTQRCISLQGLRIGGALSLSQARKVKVEPGCSVPDPCSSNPCPANSYCRDDWDSHSCTCRAGQFITEQKRILFLRHIFSACSGGVFVHPCFPPFDRLLWQQLHRCVLAEPLRARIGVHEEAELLPWLHLRLFQELLWALLREKVSVLGFF